MSTFERRSRSPAAPAPVATPSSRPHAGAALAGSPRLVAQARLAQALNASERMVQQRKMASGLDSSHRELSVLNASMAAQEEEEKK